MRLEGKVPSFVSGLLFLQHPAETRQGWIHLHLLRRVSQQAFQLAGLPGTLLSGLLDTPPGGDGPRASGWSLRGAARALPGFQNK